jgi:hypothetical protein
MRRGGVTDGLCGDNICVPVSVLCDRIPGAKRRPAITMESGL